MLKALNPRRMNLLTMHIPKTSNSGNFLPFSFYFHAREGELRFAYQNNDIIL
jgi:hypothetical protein